MYSWHSVTSATAVGIEKKNNCMMRIMLIMRQSNALSYIERQYKIIYLVNEAHTD